jgi:hypothetical protein
VSGYALPPGLDPYSLPDQRFVYTDDDGSVTVDLPAAFQLPEINDLIYADLVTAYNDMVLREHSDD